MKCPFLTKINFKKVNQVVSDDIASQQLRQCESDHIVSRQDEQNFDLSQQTIEVINSSEVNKHVKYYFKCKMNTPESSNSHLQIKFPKQFEIKPMISRGEETNCQEEQQSSEIINQSQVFEAKNIPHHLVSKISMMGSKCEDIFYGEIILEEEDQNYQCEIKDKAIRIMKQAKIKYYIEMTKVNCTLDQIKGSQLTLIANCKNNHLSLKLKFSKRRKMNSFIKAVELNNIQISQQREIEEFIISNTLNSSYSMDSLGFETQRMNIQQLGLIGDTFDILLFKNKTMMSKVQRILTNSDYDHVAMLLKTNSNEVFILESSSNLGVSVYTLKSLIELPRKKYYMRVGLRRFQGNRSYAQLFNVQQFIRQAVGKKYKFDPMYLLSSQVKKGQTFFCSELVCEALQKAGIMCRSQPSYKYLPKHFAEDTFNEYIVQGSFSDIIVVQ